MHGAKTLIAYPLRGLILSEIVRKQRNIMKAGFGNEQRGEKQRFDDGLFSVCRQTLFA